MRLSAATLVACFVLALALSARTASAVEIKKETTKSQLNGAGVTELGKPPNVPPENPGPPEVKPPKPDKPPKSKGDKDENPDDGDNGGGNDDKPPKDK
jgi:hypothetical protein